MNLTFDKQMVVAYSTEYTMYNVQCTYIQPKTFGYYLKYFQAAIHT